MKRPQISLSENELRILKQTYNIDLSDLNSLNNFDERIREDRKRFHKLEREIFVSMYPNRKKRIPNGQKCSFCLKAENEVHAMAKHESGFNLCNKCIKTIHSADSKSARYNQSILQYAFGVELASTCRCSRRYV